MILSRKQKIFDEIIIDASIAILLAMLVLMAWIYTRI